MDMKHLVMLAIQVSIFATVFGFGLRATSEDLLYLWRRPRLLVRSLLAVFVIMPMAALVLVELFDFRPDVEIVLLALAISPVPPILPKKETKAGGHNSYALGVLAILSLVSIVAVPLGLQVFTEVFGRPFQASPARVAVVVIKGAIAPLLAGMAVRAFLPALALRIEKPISLFANVLLPLAALVIGLGAFNAMWAAIGEGTVLAMVILTLMGLGIGHVLGGPNPEQSVVLALSTACRHPGLALTIAVTNFPNLQFGPIILLYLVVNALAGIPYLKWHERRQLPANVAHAH